MFGFEIELVLIGVDFDGCVVVCGGMKDFVEVGV